MRKIPLNNRKLKRVFWLLKSKKNFRDFPRFRKFIFIFYPKQWRRIPEVLPQTLRAKRLHHSLLKNRQFFRIIYGGMSLKQVSSLTRRVLRKRDRGRRGWTNLYRELSNRAASQLFHNRFFPKCKFLKQLILHRKLLVNNTRIVGNFAFVSDNLDFYSVADSYRSYFLIDKVFRKFVRRKLYRKRRVSASLGRNVLKWNQWKDPFFYLRFRRILLPFFNNSQLLGDFFRWNLCNLFSFATDTQHLKNQSFFFFFKLFALFSFFKQVLPLDFNLFLFHFFKENFKLLKKSKICSPALKERFITISAFFLCFGQAWGALAVRYPHFYSGDTSKLGLSQYATGTYDTSLLLPGKRLVLKEKSFKSLRWFFFLTSFTYLPKKN